MRILIACPTYDRRVDIEIAKGLVSLEREGVDFDVIFPVSSHISRNRNLCVHEMLKGDYDYLLFWDSDIAIEKGFLGKMLREGWMNDADIIGGCYRIKDAEGKYVLGLKKEDGTYENIVSIKEVREVDAIGTGIMLCTRRVFTTLDDPWFTIVDGKNLFCMPEDFEFSRKAKEKGFKIIAVPTFATHHWGHKSWSHI